MTGVVDAGLLMDLASRRNLAQGLRRGDRSKFTTTTYEKWNKPTRNSSATTLEQQRRNIVGTACRERRSLKSPIIGTSPATRQCADTARQTQDDEIMSRRDAGRRRTQNDGRTLGYSSKTTNSSYSKQGC